MRSINYLAAAALAAAFPVIAAAPVHAQAATPATSAAATAYVVDLSNRVFGLLNDKSVSKPALRGKFRALLSDNFALEDIGNRLIRRYRSQITPAQLTAYRAALPEFAINAYTDRLIAYRDSSVQPIRTLARGSKGDIDVYTRINRPRGSQPFDAIWTVRPTGGSFKILNLSIAGINLSLTQEADFSAYIARNGFDALVTFMKSANTKASV